MAEARQRRACRIGIGAGCCRREHGARTHGRFACWTSWASSASRIRSHANQTSIAMTHAAPAIIHGDTCLSRSSSRVLERSVTNPGRTAGRN
ncbi:adenylate/guanylate cyclase domain-containing protein [Burkholderia ambifaria]|uniref:adenylate/guanylate cyclase domain-containing protein n=1 Tax=Burkholderia ambifaria TaxID=152480 RepID=UPI00338D5006